jgi:hypothetical protein
MGTLLPPITKVVSPNAQPTIAANALIRPIQSARSVTQGFMSMLNLNAPSAMSATAKLVITGFVSIAWLAIN